MTAAVVAGAVAAMAVGFLVLAWSRGSGFWASLVGLALTVGGWSLIVVALTGGV